ncbi:HdeD family acid-resistance protein [Sorangium sp. So ce131]|uniref:HdeD family acid-resistance protein n=1 Tax=Sorangium sp. So ce131 TaxID=3133282 RepID=UPI003F625692
MSFMLVDVDTVRNNRGWFVMLGLAFMVLGLLAILLPFVASLATTIVIGWLMLIAGLIEGYHALRARAWVGAGWELVSAAVHVVAGGLVVAFPLTGKLALTAILAAYFAAEGVLKILRASQHRRVQASGWLVFDGLLSLALGILILMRWPSAAVWAIGLLVGVQLLVGGASMLLIGLSTRSEARV